MSKKDQFEAFMSDFLLNSCPDFLSAFDTM